MSRGGASIVQVHIRPLCVLGQLGQRRLLRAVGGVPGVLPALCSDCMSRYTCQVTSVDGDILPQLSYSRGYHHRYHQYHNNSVRTFARNYHHWWTMTTRATLIIWESLCASVSSIILYLRLILLFWNSFFNSILQKIV